MSASLTRPPSPVLCPQSAGAASRHGPHEMDPQDSSPSPQDAGGPQPAATRQLTDADKLRKVICELLETERTYVKVSVLPAGRPCRCQAAGSPGRPGGSLGAARLSLRT